MKANMPYFMKNKDWYYFDEADFCYKLTKKLRQKPYNPMMRFIRMKAIQTKPARHGLLNESRGLLAMSKRNVCSKTCSSKAKERKNQRSYALFFGAEDGT